MKLLLMPSICSSMLLKKVEELETRDLNWMRRIRITEKRVDKTQVPVPSVARELQQMH
jgi:hypothetical protein